MTFWRNLHFLHKLLKKFAFFSNPLSKFAIFCWNSRYFGDPLRKFTIFKWSLEWSAISAIFWLNLSFNHNILTKLVFFQQPFDKTCVFLCNLLTKFALFTQFFDKIPVFKTIFGEISAIIYQNLHFFIDPLLKFAIFQQPYDEMHNFLRPFNKIHNLLTSHTFFEIFWQNLHFLWDFWWN